MQLPSRRETSGAPDVHLRAARPDDLPAVSRLIEAASLPTEGLRDQFGPSYVVAESDGRLVAAMGIEVYGQAGLLRSAIVAAAWRGRGLGDRLVADRLAWARASGLADLYLLTTTAESYFARHGFRRVDRGEAPSDVRRSPEFASACPESAACMTLPLRLAR